MMNSKPYQPPTSTRVRCPVCHQPVYSRAGIHPQCAVRQSDVPKPKGGTRAPEPPAGPVVEPIAAEPPQDPGT